MKSFKKFVLVSGLAVVAPACSGAVSAEVDNLGSDEAALTSRTALRVLEQSLACGTSVEGALAESDRAHGYTLAAKADQRITFDLDGKFAGRGDLAVAVFAPNGSQVAFARGTTSNDVRVAFVAPVDGTYTVGVFSNRGRTVGAYAGRVACALEGLREPTAGDTEFVSYEQSWRFGPFAERAAAGASNARTVEEADIYKLVGNTLYYLNTYRGLMVIDLTDRSAPRVVGKLPLAGTPVEMFVEGNVAYALVRDVVTMAPGAGGIALERSSTSKLITLDLSRPESPRRIAEQELEGSFGEGVSRKVGNALYVVSRVDNRWSWRRPVTEGVKEAVYVHSFDLSAARAPRKVATVKVFEGLHAPEGENPSPTQESRWFTNVTLSATPNKLMVAENWYVSTSTPRTSSTERGEACGSYRSSQEARVSVFDISSPTGEVVLANQFTTEGVLGDQFKQGIVEDATTGKTTYYGIFAKQEWSYENCQFGRKIENVIESWDITPGSAPKAMGKLAFGKPNETVRGSIFDGARKLVFAITAEQVDPLYAIDIANPEQMTIKSAVDGLSGDMSVFRPIEGGKFLLAVGQDLSDACTGFDPNSQTFRSRIAASIIDVQDPSKVALVQRRCVEVQGARWMSSEVSWNLDQAHKLVSVFEDGERSLITVPVAYTRQLEEAGQTTYKSETAVGLVGFDVSLYRPGVSEREQVVLSSKGTAVHTGGSVRRAVVLPASGSSNVRELLSLSNTNLSLTAIDGPRALSTEGTLELAPFVADLAQFGAFQLQVLSPSWEQGYSNVETTFRLVQMGAGENVPAVAEFSAVNVQRAVKTGDKLVVFKHRPQTTRPAPGTWQEPALDAMVWDLANPRQPKLVGTLPMPFRYAPWGNLRAGAESVTQLNGDNTVTTTPLGLALLISNYDGRNAQPNLVLIGTEGALSVTTIPLTANEGETYQGILSGDDGTVWVTSRSELGDVTVGESTLRQVKHHARPFEVIRGQMRLGAPVNLPGTLVRALGRAAGATFVTVDSNVEMQGEGGAVVGQALRLSYRNPRGAVLADSFALYGKNVNQLAFDGDSIVATLGGSSFGFWPMARRGGFWPMYGASDDLAQFRIGRGRIERQFTNGLGLSGITLLGADNGLALFTVSGDGALLFNVRESAAPRLASFAGATGWSLQGQIVGSKGLVAAGHHGVLTLDAYAR